MSEFDGSRRGSIGMISEAGFSEWMDTSELVAAVSPPTMSYSGQLLIETGTASQMAMEIVSATGSTEEQRLRQLQASYTMESWRFRTYVIF